MYKTCPNCQYYSREMSESDCPECEGPLSLTMLPPINGDDPEASCEDEGASQDSIPRGESLELPLAVRVAQIGTGIFIFFAVSRWGSRILLMLIGSGAEVTTQAQALYLFACTAFIYVAASLAGGAVAGAWSVNWVPQGIGVGLGVLALPLLILILFMPESLPFYLIAVLVTTAFTVLGAFIGHKLIRPSQFVG